MASLFLKTVCTFNSRDVYCVKQHLSVVFVSCSKNPQLIVKGFKVFDGVLRMIDYFEIDLVGVFLPFLDDRKNLQTCKLFDSFLSNFYLMH